MDNQQFAVQLIRYAEGLKRSPLTQAESRRIIEVFNASAGTSAFERARKAIEQVIGESIGQDELRKSANLDNTIRLLQDLQMASQRFQASGPK